MTEEKKQQAKRCGARGDLSRVPCQLPPGHVKSADDWHETRSTITRTDETAGTSTKSETTETHRWEPNRFEIPGRDDED